MNPKQIAGEKAVEYIQPGMKVGLGTGSTVFYTLKKLGELVRNGLKIQGIPTSKNTEKIAREEGISLLNWKDVDRLDVTIDGADEFNPDLQLIKGGGGALFREKLVASISHQLIIIADFRKQVDVLGKFPLPVEVVPFGWELLLRQFEQKGLKPVRRMRDEEPFVTDNNNFIFDCHVGEIPDPRSLHLELKGMVGVVETGLFVDMADTVILAGKDGEVQIISRS